jgi:hypothetical protein
MGFHQPRSYWSQALLFVRALLWLSLPLYGLGLILVAAYYEPVNGIRYDTLLTASLLFRSVLKITLSDIGVAFAVWDVPYLFGYGLTAIVYLFTRPYSRVAIPLRTGVLLLQPIIVWPGWMGLGMLVATIGACPFGLDGEWLGEHWPTAIPQGLWIACSLVLAVDGVLKRATDQGADRTSLPTGPQPYGGGGPEGT